MLPTSKKSPIRDSTYSPYCSADPCIQPANEEHPGPKFQPHFVRSDILGSSDSQTLMKGSIEKNKNASSRKTPSKCKSSQSTVLYYKPAETQRGWSPDRVVVARSHWHCIVTSYTTRITQKCWRSKISPWLWPKINQSARFPRYWSFTDNRTVWA